MSPPQAVVVVGAGLAGMAAALALSEQGLHVRLLESKRSLGGRAASFRDPQTDQTIDYCQHVSLGCCTNLADFCHRTGLEDSFEQIGTLHFIGPNGQHCLLKANPKLPAPLHLLPALWGLKYLSLKDRFQIARCLGRLAKWSAKDPELDNLSMHGWLRSQSQSDAACTGFWEVILVSALGEELAKVSVSAARKVFVDGFMAAPNAYKMLVPRIPLGELYGARLLDQLTTQGVEVQTGASVRQIQIKDPNTFQLQTADGQTCDANLLVLATSWRQVATSLSPDLLAKLPELHALQQFQSSPITGIHLWFDQPITELPHAVLVNRFSQWLFRPEFATSETDADGNKLFYYQVVISAAHELVEMSKDQIITKVLNDLHELFPQSQDAQLVRSKIVTERHAVFSPQPGLNALRPSQNTSLPNLFLAGDWTQTDWPATMEGAVRSGYLAAEQVLKRLSKPTSIVVDDLPRGRLARWVIK